jgi:hypothetical protein
LYPLRVRRLELIVHRLAATGLNVASVMAADHASGVDASLSRWLPLLQ